MILITMMRGTYFKNQQINVRFREVHSNMLCFDPQVF